MSDSDATNSDAPVAFIISESTREPAGITATQLECLWP